MMEQPMLPDFPEAMARAEQKGLDTECCQMHLARQFIKYGKWAKFSKDPEFKKRMMAEQMMCAKLMGGIDR